MTIRYKLTQADLFNFNYYTEWASPDKKNFRINYCLSYLTIPLIFVFVILTFGEPQNEIKNLIVLLVIAVIMSILIIYSSIDKFRRRIRKIYSDENNFAFYLEEELILDSSNIIARNEISESRLGWSAIVKKVETTSYFYLYLNTQQAIIIPKSVLNSEELGQLKTILSENLSVKAEFNSIYVQK